MTNQNNLFALAMLFVFSQPAWSQSDEHAGHVMPSAPEPTATTPAMDHSAHGGNTMPPDSELRDPHAYADGYEYSQFPMRHAEHGVANSMIRADRLEMVHTKGDTFGVYDLKAMYGGNYDWATLKAEGDVDNSKLKEASTELLWSHAYTPFWNTQLGLRYDSGEGPNRTWVAAGIQGLAPYWFEIDATAYLGEQGRTALNVEAEYELLITQKLILQPRFTFDVYGKNDDARGIGAGISGMATGLRLRYEIRREFAPYVGVEWTGKFGTTADYARDAGERTDETLWVAGLRMWL